jgi:DNA mismatch repair protein MutS2
MNTSGCNVLEFDSLRRVLAGLAETAKGKALALDLEPGIEIALVERALQETTEARRLGDDGASPSLSDLPDLEPDLDILSIAGRVVGVDGFCRLSRFASIVRGVRRALAARREEAPRLAERSDALADLSPVDSKIRLVVDVDSEAVRDDASPELGRLRGRSRALEARLAKLLERALGSRENAKLLQEPLVTTRNGRPVLPVKAECKAQFPGIVHGSSASGATLFMEPLATVEVNNEIADLRDREAEEIRRILGALTEIVRPRREELADAVDILAEIDLAMAKARLSEIADAEPPELTVEPELRLDEARHPLLIAEVAGRAGLARPAQAPVPLTFGLAPGKRGLVFTGPNTGGKTVALKTAGLLALMAQSGLHVPARSSSRFPVFRSIFADIGDDQSIGSSLSTFSAHLAKVVEMDRELETPALVILDEVGTGTDPAEGGALGTSLVEHFLLRGALVLASTHHGLLKAYALTTEGVAAASFDFDPATYAPTYRIVEGACGRSLAFEMAERLGLSRTIVARARELQAERERQVGELVSHLEAESAELQKEKTLLADDRRAAESTRLRIETEADEERKERASRLRAFRRSLEEDVDETRRELRSLLSEAKRVVAEVRDSRQEARSRVSDLEKKLDERIDAITGPLLERLTAAPEITPPSAEDAPPLVPGARVLVASFGMEGVIERLFSEEAEVRVRDKRMRIPLRNLEALPPLAAAPVGALSVPSGTRLPKPKPMKEELNVIGCTVEEALGQADKFLDDAVLSEYRQVRLIHGHGTGRLKNALREWLEGHPHVARLESDSRGGVTVVELKD